MKEEWKPEELRATSEEIRGAVMPKSITPEMVGGTLLGIVNALGEVVEVLGEIPMEHVKVKVRGYDGTGGVSGAGATVWLDVFHSKGYPVVSLPRQELTCNDEGIVEFDVPHGYRYAVFSQIDGLGASFQMVKVAASDEREINLWNLPIGVKHLYLSVIASNATGVLRGVPMVSDSYISEIDWEDEASKAPWEWDAHSEDEGRVDDWGYYGIVVSTADTCFAIGINSKSEDRIQWSSNRDCCTPIPGIPSINHHTEEGRHMGDYGEAQDRARTDMDGNMNTAKILDYAHNPIAANFCANNIGYKNEQRWLPSGGQALLMHLNRTAINTLMRAALDAGITNFDLLPDYKPGTTQLTHYEYWWTSTIFDDYSSWVIYPKGIITYQSHTKSLFYVRAVSAFHFEY